MSDLSKKIAEEIAKETNEHYQHPLGSNFVIGASGIIDRHLGKEELCWCGGDHKEPPAVFHKSLREEPMTKDSGKWCPHWQWNRDKWLTTDGDQCIPEDDTLFCRKCGTPRPAPQEKKLWEVICRIDLEPCIESSHTTSKFLIEPTIARGLAEAAKSHIISKIPSVEEMLIAYSHSGSKTGLTAVLELIIKAIEGA